LIESSCRRQLQQHSSGWHRLNPVFFLPGERRGRSRTALRLLRRVDRSSRYGAHGRSTNSNITRNRSLAAALPASGLPELSALPTAADGWPEGCPSPSPDMESLTWLSLSVAGGRGDSDFGDDAAVPRFRRRRRSLRVSYYQPISTFLG